MTALPNPMDQFQTKILDQIKTNIAGLLPDDALQGLVERAVREVFFDPQRVPNPGGSYASPAFIDGPSWFKQEVSKQATPLIEKHVAKYLEDNPAIVKDAVDAALEKDKVAVIMSYVVGTQVSMHMGSAINNVLANLRNSMGIR